MAKIKRKKASENSKTIIAKTASENNTVQIEPSSHQTLCKIQGEVLKKGYKTSFKSIVAAILNSDNNIEWMAELTIAFNEARKEAKQ